MKKFVQISSTITIEVTGGLQSIDATNYRSSQENRLNIKTAWTKLRVLITQGVGYYPAEITTWNTVKKLAELDKITIGAECDTCPNQEQVELIRNRIVNATKENAAREAKIKKDRKIIEANAKEIDEQTRAERGVE